MENNDIVKFRKDLKTHLFNQPAGLEVSLCCKKGVKGTEAGLECDLCHYWFHTKCEGVGADLYKALQKKKLWGLEGQTVP